jgi:hypothetical protein
MGLFKYTNLVGKLLFIYCGKTKASLRISREEINHLRFCLKSHYLYQLLLIYKQFLNLTGNS